MSNYKNVTFQDSETKTDFITGEVQEKKTIKRVKVQNEEDYIKIYINDLSYLYQLDKGLDRLIYELIKYTSYQNQIIINSGIKQDIANRLGLKTNTINQYLSKLDKQQVLLKQSTNNYILNPYIFGKGKWTDIVELRQELGIQIEYDPKTNIRHIVTTHGEEKK